MANLNSPDIANNLDKLLAVGANIDNIAAKLGSHGIKGVFNRLLAAGADPEKLQRIIKEKKEAEAA